MIGSLFYIIAALIIMGVIWWALQQLIGLIPMAEPFPTIIRVVLVIIMVIVVLWVIYSLLELSGVMSMGPSLPHMQR
jgi:peptidoglycan biosynthesis protein MviN/MurJ (putative lipid II flippase)